MGFWISFRGVRRGRFAFVDLLLMLLNVDVEAAIPYIDYQHIVTIEEFIFFAFWLWEDRSSK